MSSSTSPISYRTHNIFGKIDHEKNVLDIKKMNTVTSAVPAATTAAATVADTAVATAVVTAVVPAATTDAATAVATAAVTATTTAAANKSRATAIKSEKLQHFHLLGFFLLQPVLLIVLFFWRLL